PVKGDITDETTPIPQVRRPRHGHGANRSARHCTVGAGIEVAYDLELPEEPRYDLRRRPNLRELRLRSDGQEIPDTCVRGRRTGPRPGSRQCREERARRGLSSPG